jgi:hypothetical protein
LRSRESLSRRHHDAVDAHSSTSTFNKTQQGARLHYTDSLVESVDPALRARFNESKKSAKRKKKKKVVVEDEEKEKAQEEEKKEQEKEGEVKPGDPRTYFSVNKAGERIDSNSKRKTVQQRREEAAERRRRIHNARFARGSTAERNRRHQGSLECLRCGRNFPAHEVDRNALTCMQHLTVGQMEFDEIGRTFCMSCETWFNPNMPYTCGCLPVRHRFSAPKVPAGPQKPFIVRHQGKKQRNVNRNMNLHARSVTWTASTRPQVVVQPEERDAFSDSSDPDEDLKRYERSAYSMLDLNFKPRHAHASSGSNSIQGTGSYTDEDHTRKEQFPMEQMGAVPEVTAIGPKRSWNRNRKDSVDTSPGRQRMPTVLTAIVAKDRDAPLPDVDSDDATVRIVKNVVEVKSALAKERECVLTAEHTHNLSTKDRRKAVGHTHTAPALVGLPSRKLTKRQSEYAPRALAPPIRYVSEVGLNQHVDQAVVNREKSIAVKKKKAMPGKRKVTASHARVAMSDDHGSQVHSMGSGLFTTDDHAAHSGQDVVVLSQPFLDGRRKKKPVHRGDKQRRLHPSVIYRLSKFKDHMEMEKRAISREAQYSSEGMHSSLTRGGMPPSTAEELDTRRLDAEFKIDNWKQQKVTRAMKTMKRDPSFQRIEQVEMPRVVVDRPRPMGGG